MCLCIYVCFIDMLFISISCIFKYIFSLILAYIVIEVLVLLEVNYVYVDDVIDFMYIYIYVHVCMLFTSNLVFNVFC